ncbi:hypothetical protein KP509_27G038700 [Ceratopteris richardii]|uniref:Bifunctional inhibitor/plant lipid transfer protein/seed storage helical domain-containing protein n=1 Tax=Ceratopteris richardii TaxID=49495 RepID=A0A8T2RI72_CERRI|nr:hypothetical protein KP509_27G038700 [Ceratopteris richardii]
MAALHMGTIVAVALFFSVLATLGDACGTCVEHKPPGSGGSGTRGTGAGGGTTACPVNIIKLNVCSPLLGGILGSPQADCCALLGLIGLDVEVCLCLAIEANVLGLINIDIPKLDIVARIMTACGQTLQSNFTCPL